jgi:SNF2 family DNA or RNA helicase
VLRGLTQLRQICDAPSLLADEQLHGDGSAKLSVLMEQIENKSPAHKIVIFSQFVAMLQLIRKELDGQGIPYSYLTGATQNREEEVQRFQTDADTRIFLVSLKAGGTGLNLTAADYVYLVDPWWNPAVEAQAIDRTHRIGQHKKVVAVRLICPDTVEEKIGRLQEEKKELSTGLIRSGNSLLQSITKDDWLQLLQPLSRVE